MGRALSLAVLVLAVAVVLSALLRPAPRTQDPEEAAVTPVDIQLDGEAQEGAAARFATVLSYPTVGSSDAPNHIGNPAPFQHLHDFLQRSYPLVYEKLEHERVGAAAPGWAAQGIAVAMAPPAGHVCPFGGSLQSSLKTPSTVLAAWPADQ